VRRRRVRRQRGRRRGGRDGVPARAARTRTARSAIIGFCSGGRHTYLAGCRLPNINALVDCWGGNVVVDDPKALNAKRPVAPIDLTDKMTAPLLGLFGNDDENPNADQGQPHRGGAEKARQVVRIPRYDGAGHAFFNHARAPAYRADQAADGWKKVFAFSRSTSADRRRATGETSCALTSWKRPS
jgi:carboxymethylenebutenolidase